MSRRLDDSGFLRREMEREPPDEPSDDEFCPWCGYWLFGGPRTCRDHLPQVQCSECAVCFHADHGSAS